MNYHLRFAVELHQMEDKTLDIPYKTMLENLVSEVQKSIQMWGTLFVWLLAIGAYRFTGLLKILEQPNSP